jgi:hypothetical protein
MNNSVSKTISLFLVLIAIESVTSGPFYTPVLLVVGLVYLALSILVFKEIKAGIILSKLICTVHFSILSVLVFFVLLFEPSIDSEALMTILVKVDQLRRLFVLYVPFLLLLPCLFFLFLKKSRIN